MYFFVFNIWQLPAAATALVVSVIIVGRGSLNGLSPSPLLLDGPEVWQLAFQDGAAVTTDGIQELHNSVIFFVVAIVMATVWGLLCMVVRFGRGAASAAKYLNHGTALELVWTVSPAFILIAVAFPSFRLLYLIDEVISPALTVKVLGHQWYWSYEYSDMDQGEGSDLVFDSYMVPSGDLEEGGLRLLEVDNPVSIPVGVHTRFVITSTDVIHSWAVPSLGIKLDAIPGRLNQTSTLAERTGSFYGQCSELCGVYHGFMPIVVNAMSVPDYVVWLLEES